jgi:hypothetical protein
MQDKGYTDLDINGLGIIRYQLLKNKKTIAKILKNIGE